MTRDASSSWSRWASGVKGDLYQPGQVDGAEQTGAVGRQRLLAAGIGGVDRLAVGQVVPGIDAVDEDDTGLGVVVRRAGDAVEQRAGTQRLVGLAIKEERPLAIGIDGRHERVGRQNRQVEVAQPPRLALGRDEVLNVGVIASHGGHHCAAPRPGGHDGAAHGVPYIHEGERAGGVGTNAFHWRALRPQGGEVVADAATLLHGQRGLAQMIENAAEVVGDVAHDEAIEQGHAPVGAGARQDAARRQEPEVLQRLVEGLLPLAGLGLHGSQGTGYPPPAILDGEVDRRAIGILQPVFGVPDLPRDRCCTGQCGAGVRFDIHIHDLLLFTGHHALFDPIHPVARPCRGQGRRGIPAAGAPATHPCGRCGGVACPSHPNCLSSAAAAAPSIRDGSVLRPVKRSEPRNHPSERLSPGRSAMKQDGLA